MASIPTPAELAAMMQFPIHRPPATAQDVERHCAVAREHKFGAVSVNGCRVELARHCLEDSEVKVTAVVGFPLGAMSCDAKRFEAEAAIDDGAQEIQMVLNVGFLKDRDTGFVLRELHDVVEAADERPVTVAIESGLLAEDEIRLACSLIVESGAKFVSTSTGFADAEATVAAVRWVRECAGDLIGITACGLITSAVSALALVEAGATRLCTANAVAVVESLGPGREQPSSGNGGG